MGIGLSVVRKIVKINNREVYLKSKLRKGTTFYFTNLIQHLPKFVFQFLQTNFCNR